MLRLLLNCALTICFLSSCHGPVIGQRQDIIIVDVIRKEHNFSLAKQGFVRIGRNEAYDPVAGKIKEFYQTRKLRFETVDDAKSFFTQFFANYLQPLNSDKRLKDYFADFPLSSQNVELEITFLDDYAIPLKSPSIARVKNVGNTVLFFTFDEKTNRFIEQAQADTNKKQG